MARDARALKQMFLTACEVDLIDAIRALHYGHLTIDVQAGQPTRILEGVKSRKLGGSAGPDEGRHS